VFADAVVCGIDWAIAHGFDLMNASLTIDPNEPPIDNDVLCKSDPDRAAVIAIVRAAVLRAARKERDADRGDREQLPEPGGAG